MNDQRTELRIAFDSRYPPFSEGADGEGHGLLLELWRAIAGNAGMQLRPVFGVWHEAMEAVLAGRADAHSGMLRSPEREKIFAFSVGLFSISTFLFVRADEKGKLLQDFADRSIGAVAESHEYEYLRSKIVEPNVCLFENNELLLRAAITGEVPAIVVDFPVAKTLLKRFDRLHALKPGEHLYSRSLRAALPVSRRDTLTLVNTAIEAVPPEEIERITEAYMPDMGSEWMPQWLLPAALTGGAVLSVSYLSSMVNRLIRERDQINRRLEQSEYRREEIERRFSSLAGSIPGFVYRCHTDGAWSVEYISDGCRYLTGYEQEDFLDRPDPPRITDFVHEKDIGWLHEIVRNSLRDGRLIDAEYRMVDRYGTEHWVLERGRAVGDEDGEVRFIEGLVTDITDRKNAEARATENARLQRLIADVIAELATAIPENLDEKLNASLARIVVEFRANRAYLMSSDEHLNAFRLTHDWATDSASPSPGYVLYADYPSEFESLAAGEPVTVEIASTAGGDTERGKETVWWCPVMQNNRCRGLLGVNVPVGDDRLTERERQTLQIIINLMSEALQRVELQEELKRQSITDPLTGAYNRRFFEERIAVAQHEYGREGRNSAVIMLDLDRFKELNDTYGHYVGDTVLRDFTTAITREIRPSDVLARYGGEEFVLLLAATGLDDAEQVAERVRSRVAGRQVVVGNSTIRYTVSAGVAATDEPGDTTPVTLLDRSDRRLYTAKASGRNAVVGRQ